MKKPLTSKLVGGFNLLKCPWDCLAIARRSPGGGFKEKNTSAASGRYHKKKEPLTSELVRFSPWDCLATARPSPGGGGCFKEKNTFAAGGRYHKKKEPLTSELVRF